MTPIGHDIDTPDIPNTASVDAVVAAKKPDLIMSVAACTSVDKAEFDEDGAYAVNATAVGLLADAARAWLVHVLSDFVFDGLSGTPYGPEANTRCSVPALPNAT